MSHRTTNYEFNFDCQLVKHKIVIIQVLVLERSHFARMC